MCVWVCVCALIFTSLCCDLVLWYELNKTVTRHFIVFSNKAPCKEETEMAVAFTMTGKIGLIWRHIKPSVVDVCFNDTLYYILLISDWQ